MRTTRTIRAPMISGRQLHELREMLAHSSVGAESPLLLHGTEVKVMATVWDSEDSPGRFDVLVSAFDPDGTRLNLSCLGLKATAGESSYESRIAKRGDLAIDGLPAESEYRLEPRWRPVLVQAAPMAQTQAVAAPHRQADIAEPLALAARGVEEGAVDAAFLLNPIQSYPFDDGQGLVSVLVREEETIVIAETQNERYAGATVDFKFLELATGRDVFSGALVLEPGERAGLWLNRVSFTPPADTGPCELRFTVARRT